MGYGSYVNPLYLRRSQHRWMEKSVFLVSSASIVILGPAAYWDRAKYDGALEDLALKTVL